MLGRLLKRFAQTYREPGAGLVPDGDPGRWAAACHSLRGACAAVGAQALADQVGQLEQVLAGHADPAALRPEVRQLQAMLDTLVLQLDAATRT
jgi:HPt (histidine-containing phosphotransfer) domain-containing protein